MSERWGAALAATLEEITRRLTRLAESVADDWSDEHGRDWSERAVRLRHDLSEQAAAAAGLGERIEPAGVPAPGGARLAAPPTGRPGVRLGDLDGHRVDDERGVRIAQLPPVPGE